MSNAPSGFSWCGLRLFQAQETISENLNIPLRLLRSDCIENLQKILPEEVFSQLSATLDQTSVENSYRDEIPASLRAALSSDDEVHEAKVSHALWASPRSAPNPFYEELKAHFPKLRAQVRFYLLRQLKLLLNDTAARHVPIRLKLPGNLVALLASIGPRGPEGRVSGFLVAGPVRMMTESVPSSSKRSSRFVDLEQQVSRLIKELSVEEPLTIEDQTHILVLSSSYLNYSDRDLHLKANVAQRVLSRILELEEQGEDLLNSLSSADWTRVVQFIFFWLSERSLPVIESVVCTKSTHRNLIAETRISSANSSGQVFAVRMVGAIQQKDSRSSFEDLTFSILEASAELEQLRFAYSDGSALEAGQVELLSYFFHRSLEDRHANRAWQEYVSFDRLRHSLQHLPVDELPQRQLLFTERARELVRADVAVYLYFNSLEDHLLVGSVSTAPWIVENDVQKFGRWLRETAQKPEERRRSAIYRCLDTRCYQSRLTVSPEDHPFASGWVNRLPHVSADREFWGVDANDFIAVPVQFHGRMLGVLYVAAGTANRFRYYDRIRLLSFVRMFEAEFFEAKLFKAIREMNEDLGSALRGGQGGLTQGSFCDRLMQKLGHLLTVAGAILWWQSPFSKQTLQVLGFAGRKIASSVRHGQEEARKSFPWPAITGSESPVVAQTLGRKDLSFTKRNGWRLDHSLAIFLPDLERRNYLGVITLHDSSRISATEFPAEELQFVRDELGQNVISFMEHHERLRTTRDMIGHDVSSALKHIEGIRKRLTHFQSALPIDSRELYKLRLDDLDRNVRRAHLLLDVLTSEAIQSEVRKRGDIFSVLYQFLNEQLLQPLAPHSAVTAAVHGRASDLRARSIKIVFSGPHPPPLWVESGAVEEVVANLVDNVVKYGAPKKQLQIEYRVDSLEYFIHFRSWGYALRQDFLKRPDVIFEMGIRGIDEVIARKTPGSGKGLFSSSQIAKVWDGNLSLEYRHQDPWALFEFILSFPRNLADRQNPWLK